MWTSFNRCMPRWTPASHTTIPEELLRDLGIEPSEERPFRLADESLATYPVGQARVRLLGQEWIVPVVFTPEGRIPLLGVITLEIFRLAIDQVALQLISVPGLLKRAA
jgi:predicted aspartyl protease